MKPLVSIGVPSYNCAAYIWDTLESVRAQSYPNIELIIIDDCSTDESVAVIQRWVTLYGNERVRFVQNPVNLGLVKTCNALLSTFRGVFYTILGSDDVLLASKVEHQVAEFERNEPDYVVVYSDSMVIDATSAVVDESYFKRQGFLHLPHGDVYEALLERNFISAPSVLVRTAAVQGIGGYDESLAFEDWDIWLRLAQHHKFALLDKPLAKYRIHANSMMQNTALTLRLNQSYMLMYQKHQADPRAKKVGVNRKIQDRAIYAYYKGDKRAPQYLFRSLLHVPRVKVFLYLLLAVLGVRLQFKA